MDSRAPSYRLVFSESAVKDLKRITSFLHEKNPGTARKALKKVHSSMKRLQSHPRLGRRAFLPASHEDEIRELIAPFGQGSYVIRYQVVKSEIRIARIIHSKEAPLL